MGNVAESIRYCIDLPLESGVLFLGFCFKVFLFLLLRCCQNRFWEVLRTGTSSFARERLKKAASFCIACYIPLIRMVWEKV